MFFLRQFELSVEKRLLCVSQIQSLFFYPCPKENTYPDIVTSSCSTQKVWSRKFTIRAAVKTSPTTTSKFSSLVFFQDSFYFISNENCGILQKKTFQKGWFWFCYLAYRKWLSPVCLTAPPIWILYVPLAKSKLSNSVLSRKCLVFMPKKEVHSLSVSY